MGESKVMDQPRAVKVTNELHEVLGEINNICGAIGLRVNKIDGLVPPETSPESKPMEPDSMEAALRSLLAISRSINMQLMQLHNRLIESVG